MMAMTKCPECGTEISDRSTMCIHCGCPIEAEKMITCPECGQEVPSKAEVCAHCGCPIRSGIGTITIQTDERGTGLLGRYIINDESGNLLAKVKPGEVYQAQIYSDVALYIRLTTAFGSFQKIVAYAGHTNKFLAFCDGFGLSITKME